MADSSAQLHLFPGSEPRRPNDLTPAVRQGLVEGCLNLCRKLARQSAGYVTVSDVEDLEGEAFLACTVAATYWRPEGDAKFSTFAQSYIRERLKGLASDQQRRAIHTHSADFDLMADERDDGDEDGESTADVPTPADEELIIKLPEQSREVVRLAVFDRLPPERIADRLGYEVKDVKLVMRNAAKELVKQKLRLSRPGLFADPEDDPEPPPCLANAA